MSMMVVAMPRRPPRHCTAPGCPETLSPGESRCPRHQNERARRRAAAKRASTAKVYDREHRERSERMRRQHPICQACGRRRSRHLDHIDGNPKNNHPSNLQVLCIPCHSKKTATHDGGFGNPRSPRPG